MPDRNPLLDGLASVTYLPAGPPVGAVVVLHGAGSSKESHADFARLCTAHDLAAVVFDQRGHGESAGPMDHRMASDVATIAGLFPDLPIGLRGSSMGGYLALAAAREVSAAAVVAICPATADGLAAGFADGHFGIDVDVPAATRFLDAHPAEGLAIEVPCPLMLMHAEHDESVPLSHSFALHAVASGSTLVVAPGGDHRSVQHDPELQAQSVRFLREALVGAAG